jgi:HK97 family phage major capsid protein
LLIVEPVLTARQEDTMALTKAQAALLTQDMLQRGVIETITKESAVLRYLPFEQVVGTAVTFNKESAAAAVAWYDVGDTWAESVATFSQATQALSVLGGDADVDAFLSRTYADPNDLEALIIETKAKALAYEFNAKFFDGDTSVDPKAFNGLNKQLTGTSQELLVAANGGALTLDKLDELIDLVKPGKPDALFMSRRSRRKLKSLRRSSGAALETSMNQFGETVDTYDGIPVEIDDNILDTYTYGSSGAVCSRIYAVQFGMGRGVIGFENGGLQVEPVGPLETKNARRWRLKWYVTAVLQRPLGAAVLGAINGS